MYQIERGGGETCAEVAMLGLVAEFKQEPCSQVIKIQSPFVGQELVHVSTSIGLG